MEATTAGARLRRVDGVHKVPHGLSPGLAPARAAVSRRGLVRTEAIKLTCQKRVAFGQYPKPQAF